MMKKVKLSERLLCVSKYIGDNTNFVDVACDHAYLSIYLAQNRKNINIIACDIAKKPLEFAENNLVFYNMKDKIKLILSDGLKNIENFNIKDVAICGVGGELAFNILNDTKNKENIHFVLQPMSQYYFLRKNLYLNRFQIKNEECVIENNKMYLIMNVFYSNKTLFLDEMDFVFGDFKNKNDEISMIYKNYIFNKINTIYNNILNKKDVDKNKIKEYKDFIKRMKKFL